MVATASGYFEGPFEGHQGVTHGGGGGGLPHYLQRGGKCGPPALGTKEPVTEGFVREIQWLAEYSYTDDRLIASTM